MKVLRGAKAATGPVKLDAYDRTLLTALAENARTPRTRLAKRIRLSRSAVDYRIERLERLGVLVGTRTVIDVDALGFLNFHVFIRVRSPSEGYFRGIEKVAALPWVRGLIQLYGRYDYEVATVARSLTDMDEKLNVLLEHFGSDLQDVLLLPVIATVHSIQYPGQRVTARKAKTPAARLDDTDVQILRALRHDATRSLVSLSQDVGLTAEGVKRRLRRLQSVVIAGYVPIIDYAQIGLGVSQLLVRTQPLTSRERIRLDAFLRGAPQVLWAAKTLGSYQLIVYTLSSDDEALFGFIKELRAILSDKLQGTELLRAVDEFVYTYAPDSLFD